MKTILGKWLQKNFTNFEAIFLSILLLTFFIILKTMGAVLFPVIASIIIAYLLNNLVILLEKWKISHFLAVIIVFSIFIGFLVVILLWLLPLLFQQLSNLFYEAPRMLTRGQEFLLNLQTRYPELFSSQWLKEAMVEFSKYVSLLGQFILSISLASINNVFLWIIYLILVPLLVFFFLKDKKIIKNWLYKFLPTNHQIISKIFNDIDKKATSYISGRLIESILVTIICMITFLSMKLNFAILLSVCVGISVIIPYVGAILVTIPIVIIAFLQWGFVSHFAYLLMVYAFIITFDANVLVPLLFSERMHLHPVAIIIALLIFGYLWGFWGVFFAIPLAVVVNTLINNWPQNRELK